MVTGVALERRVEAVRRFNRFWTRRIGVLDEGYLSSQFSLTEVRVLYELAQREETTAREIRAALGLDAGYLSRILRGFEERGLVAKRPSEEDARSNLLRLTAVGRKVFAPLDARSREGIGAMLAGLSPDEGERLIGAVDVVEELLGERRQPEASYVVRPPGPGDMGWVVSRHGALYAREYGWDETFEALVARIVADFVDGYDPEKERCWIAERGGEPVGCVFLVKESEKVAKLRLLLVEPAARGLGIGGRLVDECLGFARDRGYEKVTLWTNDVLHAARHIYEKASFRLVHEEPHHSFGHDLVGQTWELSL